MIQDVFKQVYKESKLHEEKERRTKEGKEISCGTLIEDAEGNFLACHPTGKSRNDGNWDIPKGHWEQKESAKDCAIRECFEETGWDISKYADDMKDVGTFEYTSYKDLKLFYLKVDKIPDVDKMKCTTYFIDRWGRNMPEVNDYKLTTNFNTYFKVLQKVFLQINV